MAGRQTLDLAIGVRVPVPERGSFPYVVLMAGGYPGWQSSGFPVPVSPGISPDPAEVRVQGKGLLQVRQAYRPGNHFPHVLQALHDPGS